MTPKFALYEVVAVFAFFQHVCHGGLQGCPPMGTIDVRQIGEQCMTSRMCPPAAMCCNTIRGMRCVDLVNDIPPAFGQCADGSRPSQRCNPGVCPPNYKCENGKCCWNNPYGPPPRPMPSVGTCDDGTTSRVPCQSHADCGYNQHCYAKWCCPLNRRLPQDNSGQCEDGSISYTRCSSHRDCGRQQTCYGKWCCPRQQSSRQHGYCFDGTQSRMRCTNGMCPAGYACEEGWCCAGSSGGRPSKPGRCSPFMSVPGQITSDSCVSDFECPGTRKCCRTTAGRRCLLPEM